MMTALLPRLFGDVNDWFDIEFSPRAHLLRIEESLTDQEYTLRAELPGTDPDKDVQVTFADGMLTIRAERREEQKTAHHSEFRYGAFRRTMRLPANADAEKITATYEKGILTVTVPLTAPAPAGKQIPVATTAG
jgi:HSP20 family molecular chaperone IbpA